MRQLAAWLRRTIADPGYRDVYVEASAKARKPSRHDGTPGSHPRERARWLFAPREPGLRVAARGGGGA